MSTPERQTWKYIFIAFCLLVTFVYALFTSIRPGSYCKFRYDNPDSAVSFQKTTLRASGRYDDVPCQNDNSCLQDSRYGQWLKVLDVNQNEQIDLAINGSVTLCESTDYNGLKVPLTDVLHTGGLPIVLKAQKTEIPIVNVLIGDRIKITVGENSLDTKQNFKDAQGKTYSSDCAKGEDGQSTKFNPVCNRFSPYVDAKFAYACDVNQNLGMYKDCTQGGGGCAQRPESNPKCNAPNTCVCFRVGEARCNSCPFGIDECGSSVCLSKTAWQWKSSACTIKTVRILPDVYTVNKIYDNNRKIYTSAELIGLDNSCSSIPSDVDARSWFAFQAEDKKKKFSGLYYTIRNDQSKKSLPLKPLEIIIDAPDVTVHDGSKPRDLSSRVIFDGRIKDLPDGDDARNYFAVSFEQFQGANYTGGYVVYLKHDKCYRENGEYWSVAPQNDALGQVRYLILQDGDNPNTTPALVRDAKALNFFNKSSSFVAYTSGTVWMRIENKVTEYKNSRGEYEIIMGRQENRRSPGSERRNGSAADDSDPLMYIVSFITDEFKGASQRVFQNLVCYQASNTSSCDSLFNIIRALLSLYIILYGMQFALGMIKVNQIDFIVRVIKVIIVAGLMNGNTFSFFNEYLFDLIFKASDQIMGAMHGSQGLHGNTIALFFREIYAVIANDITIFQLAAQLGTGLSGIMVFIIVLMSMIIFLMSILEFAVVYVFCYLGVAILISLAPVFLVFVLFQQTRFLFDNWVKFIVRYTFEPVIFFFGISLLTKLFMVYLDYILSYSVCFKCVMTFKIPGIEEYLPIFLAPLAKQPVFCLYWFAPWGYDPIAYNYAAALHNIIGLFVIAFTTAKYPYISTQISFRIFGGPMGSKGDLWQASEVRPRMHGAIKSFGHDLVEKMKNYKNSTSANGQAQRPKINTGVHNQDVKKEIDVTSNTETKEEGLQDLIKTSGRK